MRDTFSQHTHKNKSRNSYQINTFSTIGTRALGKRRNVLLKLFAILSLGKPVSQATQAKNTKKLVETSSKVTDSNIEMTAKEVHSISKNNRIYSQMLALTAH